MSRTVPRRDVALEEAMWAESLAAHRRAAESATTRPTRGRAQGNAAQALDNLAFLAQRRGALTEAGTLREESLALKRDNADALGIGLSLLAIGALSAAKGDSAGARATLRDCLDHAQNLRDVWLAAAALEALAEVAVAGRPARALHLAGAAASLRELIDAPLSEAERSRQSAALRAAREALGERGADAAWNWGRSLTIAQARAEDLGDLAAPPEEGTSGEPRADLPGDLTAGLPSDPPAFGRRASREALTTWHGRLVDVGEHRLYMRCQGRSDPGTPTVLFSAGLGSDWLAWERVAPAIGAHARVVTYSRAGLRDSEPGALPRTTRLIVDDLRAMLVSARLSPPYVLVGRAFGALVHRLFAARYPSEVAGMMMFDAEEQLDANADGDVIEHVDMRASIEESASAAALRGVPLVSLETVDDEPEHTIRAIEDVLDHVVALTIRAQP